MNMDNAFKNPILTGCESNAGKCERASQLSTTCVWSSDPVTIFPTALKAAVCTFTSLCESRGTSFGTTPLNMTISI